MQFSFSFFQRSSLRHLPKLRPQGHLPFLCGSPPSFRCALTLFLPPARWLSEHVSSLAHTLPQGKVQTPLASGSRTFLSPFCPELTLRSFLAPMYIVEFPPLLLWQSFSPVPIFSAFLSFPSDSPLLRWRSCREGWCGPVIQRLHKCGTSCIYWDVMIL